LNWTDNKRISLQHRVRATKSRIQNSTNHFTAAFNFLHYFIIMRVTSIGL